GYTGSGLVGPRLNRRSRLPHQAAVARLASSAPCDGSGGRRHRPTAVALPAGRTASWLARDRPGRRVPFTSRNTTHRPVSAALPAYAFVVNGNAWWESRREPQTRAKPDQA